MTDVVGVGIAWNCVCVCVSVCGGGMLELETSERQKLLNRN